MHYVLGLVFQKGYRYEILHVGLFAYDIYHTHCLMHISCQVNHDRVVIVIQAYMLSRLKLAEFDFQLIYIKNLKKAYIKNLKKALCKAICSLKIQIDLVVTFFTSHSL